MSPPAAPCLSLSAASLLPLRCLFKHLWHDCNVATYTHTLKPLEAPQASIVHRKLCPGLKQSSPLQASSARVLSSNPPSPSTTSPESCRHGKPRNPQTSRCFRRRRLPMLVLPTLSSFARPPPAPGGPIPPIP
ncbi:hypothetical protein DFH06DRAFT_1342264 [Mycena polygramma]|nr:hypothetical protein DFH06DRAFT_1342264 [Mycena polygramma]